MARRRHRKNEGLIEVALRSDWKVSATLAGASFFGGAVLIPATLGRSALLQPLAGTIGTLASVLAFVFAAISLVRFLTERPPAQAASSFHRRSDGPSRPALHPTSPNGIREETARLGGDAEARSVFPIQFQPPK